VGATGPAGVTGYAYFYNHSAQVVAAGNNVTLDTNGPLTADFTHTAGTAPIIVNTSGTYSVTFSVTGTVASQFTLLVNGVAIAGADYSTGTDGQNSGQVIVTLLAGDILTLRNTSVVPVILQLGVTNASVLFLKLA
jgi:hypothetical protein